MHYSSMCMHVHVHVHMHVHVHVHMHVYVHVHVYVCTCVCMHIYNYVYVCMLLLGSVYTEEPVVRSFNRDEHLVLNVNILSDPNIPLINSLAWYHNGTKLLAGNKYGITNNTKTLTISDMTGSDAGVYEVKINSISYNSNANEDQDCDSIVLPLLEKRAILAPVTFTVQEQSLPEYNPSSIISTYYIMADSDVGNGYDIELRGEVHPNNFSLRSAWYRNGTQLYNENMYNITATNQALSLRITANSTTDFIGDYVGILWARLGRVRREQLLCQDYYNYLLRFFYPQYPLNLIFWSIKLPSELS